MRFPSVGLTGRILVILLVVMATEFAANTLLFDRASQFALEDDDARRMAEHLVVAQRVLDHTPAAQRPAIARELSTVGFAIQWEMQPPATPPSLELDRLRGQILSFQPELLDDRLQLRLAPPGPARGIAGNLDLTDKTQLYFQARQSRALLSLTLGWLMTMLAPTLALVLVGGLMIRAAFRPLSVLMKATRHVGTDDHVHVPEQGSSEVRSLIHAFNAMHSRIQRLITSRTQSLVAVAHDLRTPLARLRLRIEDADIPPPARIAMDGDIAELNGLLQSLQDFLNGEAEAGQPESVDIAAMAATLIDNAQDQGANASYHGPDSLDISARVVSLRRALANLVDNALHYGGNVRLILRAGDEETVIRVEDDGPGIPPEMLGDVLKPFVRADDARARNTSGMGLGLAIVQNAVRLDGGTLTLENRIGGGLSATIRLPRLPVAK